MASKGKKPAASTSASKKSNSSSAREEEEHQDPLQAVILTEFFETRFAPLTLERPRVSTNLFSYRGISTVNKY
jgi:hypothetical protein